MDGALTRVIALESRRVAFSTDLDTSVPADDMRIV